MTSLLSDLLPKRKKDNVKANGRKTENGYEQIPSDGANHADPVKFVANGGGHKEDVIVPIKTDLLNGPPTAKDLENAEERERLKSEENKSAENKSENEQGTENAETDKTQDGEKKEEKVERFFFQVAKDCTVDQETGIVLYNPGARNIAQLIAPQKMNDLRSSFSIRILKAGDSAKIAIGLVPKDYLEETLPGWREHSIGYHADDGGIFIECRWSTKMTTVAKDGDIMSFDINMNRKIGHFKKNGKVCIELNLNPEKIGLYPCIAIRSAGAAVQILQEDNRFVKEVQKYRAMTRKLLGDVDKLTHEEFKTFLNEIGYEPKEDKTASFLETLDPMSTGFVTRSNLMSLDFFLKHFNNDDLEPVLSSWSHRKDSFIPPALTTEKLEDIWISPAKTLTMTEVKRNVYNGWLSFYNPSYNELVLKVTYGIQEKRSIYHVLQYKESWVEYLEIQKGKREERTSTASMTELETDQKSEESTDNLTAEGVIEWVVLNSSPRSSTDEELEKIFQEDGQEVKRKELTIDLVEAEKFEEDDSSESKKKQKLRDDTSKDLLKYLKLQRSVKSEFDEVVKNVEDIIKNAKDLNIQDEDENTPLHYAADLKLRRVAALLLNHGADPDIENKEEMLPLECAIQSSVISDNMGLEYRGPHDKLGELIVRKMKNFSVRDLFWDRRDHYNIKLTINNLLHKDLELTTMAVLDSLQNKLGSYCVAPLELDEFSRNPEDRLYCTKHETAYQKIARQERKALASHDCVKNLTHRKWDCYAGKIFMGMALVYLLSLFSLTFAAVTGVLADDIMSYNSPIDVARAVFEVLAYAYALLTATGEVLQLKKHRKEYLMDMFNYMEVLSSALILAILPLRLTHCTEQWYVFAFGYILWTFRIFKYAAIFRTTGIFGHILLKLIIYDVPKFVLLFLIVLLSFSGGLFLALKGDDNLTVHEETSSFWGILFVGVRTLTEAQSVVDYTGSEGYRTVSCIVMLIFLFITCVLLLNILIAQLSDRYTSIQTDAEREFEMSRLKIVARIELMDDFTCFYWGEALWKKHYSEDANLSESTGEYEQNFDSSTALDKMAMDLAKNTTNIEEMQKTQQSIQETQKHMQKMLENLLISVEKNEGSS